MSYKSNPARLFHIAIASEWRQALERGRYWTGSLNQEGFIHFSTGKQLLRSANKYYSGRDDVVLLWIDPARLVAELKYEPISDGQLFPHLYGELNLDAVIRVIDFKPQADGSFSWPDSLGQTEDEQ